MRWAMSGSGPPIASRATALSATWSAVGGLIRPRTCASARRSGTASKYLSTLTGYAWCAMLTDALNARSHAMTACRTVLLLVATLVLGAQLAQAQSGKPKEFRDCETCPLMVELPTGTAMGKFPITRGEFRLFAKETKLESEGCILRVGKDRHGVAEANWLKPGYEQTDDHPVVCVNWLEATAYTEWLSEKTGKKYRLPTLEESSEAAAGGSK